MRTRHPATDGIEVVDLSPDVPKWFRGEMLALVELTKESGADRDDFGAGRHGDALSPFHWRADLAHAATTASKVPRGSGATKGFIFPALVTKAPRGEYDSQANEHAIRALRDITSTDPDLAELEKAERVYTGHLKIPAGIPSLVMRGTGHQGASRGPMVFPFAPLIAQHGGLDVSDFDSMVHDTYDNGGQNTISYTQRAGLSTVFKVADVPDDYPINRGNGTSASKYQMRKVVALNFGPADASSPRFARQSGWHGSGMGAAYFGIGNLVALLSASAMGPLGYSPDPRHVVDWGGGVRPIVTTAALMTVLMWSNNDRSTSTFGQRTGPIGSWRPDTNYKPEPEGARQIPVKIVWNEKGKYRLHGKDLTGTYELVALTDWKSNNPSGNTAATPATGGQSGGVPGGPGGGGGNPPKGGGPNGGNGGPGGKGGNGGEGAGSGGPKGKKAENPQDAKKDDKPNKGVKDKGDGEGGGNCERRSFPPIEKMEERIRRAVERGAGKRYIEWLRRRLQRMKERHAAAEAKRQRNCATHKRVREQIEKWQRSMLAMDDFSDDLTSLIADDYLYRADGPVIHEVMNGEDGGLEGMASEVGGGAGPDGSSAAGTPPAAVTDTDPTTQTTREVEAPSIYFHARPASPQLTFRGDARGVADGITTPGGVKNGQIATALHKTLGGIDYGDPDSRRRAVEGFTDEENAKAPIVAHEVTAGVYDMSVASSGSQDPNRRYPPELTQEGMADDGSGNRVPSFGDGGVVLLPGRCVDGHQYIENKSELPDGTMRVTRAVAAAGTGGVAKIDGRTGLGLVGMETGVIHSGIELRLDHSGPGGSDEPDAHIVIKDEDGNDSAVGRIFINGVDVSTLSGGGDQEDDEANEVLGSSTSPGFEYTIDPAERFVFVDNDVGGTVVTVYLPDSPAAGKKISVTNLAYSVEVIEVSAAPGGHDIDASSSPFPLAPGESVTLKFSTTYEWTVI